ncbi:MAG: peptidoglycan-binding domain-containing protein [Pseudomonadota bacterium]
MGFKNFTMTCAAAALMAVPATRATADSRDFAAGIVAGVIGSAVVRNANKQKRVVRKSSTRKYKAKPRVSNAVREQNREVQTSLNYFGFPAGSPDGVLGRNSRAAISAYQAHLGYPATGQLTQYERDFLLQSYHRAIAGGAITTQAIAGNPLGPKGLLNQYRDEAAGVTTTVTATQPVVTPQAPAASTTVVALQPQVLQPQVLPTQPAATAVAATAGAAAATGALPNFLGGAEAQSLASHCNQVMLVASTNGYTTEANMTDGASVLGEQVCLARNYAITQGDQLAAAVKGATPQQIEAQCAQFGPILAPMVASLAVKPADQVTNDVNQFVQTSGMAPAQLSGTAKICLSVGYRTDNMDVAVGSALLLTTLGEAVYGELMGHHLSQGFGVTQRGDLSRPWYDMALTAVEQGATPVFNPGDQNRTALLRRAVFNPTSSAVTTQPQVQPAAAALPTFNIQN